MKNNSKFRSGISSSIVLAMIAYHALIFGLFILSYFLYDKKMIYGIASMLIIADVVFLLPLIFNTYYTLEEHTLFIHQWPFLRVRIKYSEIFEIDNDPAEKPKYIKSAALSSNKIMVGYYVYSEDKKTKTKKYIEISPAEADLFLIKMGGKFKSARDLAAKLEEEHKQKNAEHHRKKAIADKIRKEKEEQNKPVDVVVKAVKKGEVKTSLEDENTEE